MRLGLLNEYGECDFNGKIIEVSKLTVLSAMLSNMDAGDGAQLQRGIVYQSDSPVAPGRRRAYRDGTALPTMPDLGMEDPGFGRWVAYPPGPGHCFEWWSLNGSAIKAEPVFLWYKYGRPELFYALTYEGTEESSGKYSEAYERFGDLGPKFRAEISSTSDRKKKYGLSRQEIADHPCLRLDAESSEVFGSDND